MSRFESRPAQRGWLRTLTYHRIDTPERRPTDYPGLISATPDQFHLQMKFVAQAYSVVSLQQVMAAADGKSVLPPNALLLTFDDATIDFAEHVWPILKSLQLPATVFVPTAYPDEPTRHFWWNRLFRAVCLSPAGTKLPTPGGQCVAVADQQRSRLFRVWRSELKSIPHNEFEQNMRLIIEAGNMPDPSDNGVLPWSELCALHREGVTLAPHTHTHPMLNRLPRESVISELVNSRDCLRRNLGCEVPPALAYPAGGINEIVTSAMTEAGFRLGFTTQRGLNPLSLDSPLHLKRINVGGRTTLGLLRLQMANWGL